MSNPEKDPVSLETDPETLVLERQETKKPRRYLVFMHNDDYTTQDFVVHLLMKFFYQDKASAQKLMLQVHTQGKAKVGTYTKDVAESKVGIVTSYAHQNGMPLLLTAEPES